MNLCKREKLFQKLKNLTKELRLIELYLELLCARNDKVVSWTPLESLCVRNVKKLPWTLLELLWARNDQVALWSPLNKVLQFPVKTVYCLDIQHHIREDYKQALLLEINKRILPQTKNNILAEARTDAR